MSQDIDIEETNFRKVPPMSDELIEALDTFSKGTATLTPEELTHNLRVIAAVAAGAAWRVNEIIGSGVHRKIKVKQ